MERKSGFACLVMMMMLCVGAGQFETGSLITERAKCFGIVYNLCRFTKSPFECLAKATSQCSSTTGTVATAASRSSSNYGVASTRNYCELGCVFSRCANITTSQPNPNLDQLGSCFESCSENTCKPETNGGNDDQTSDEFCKLGCAKSICGETADKDTVCQPCDTACPNISNIGHMSHV